jgi:hypothetical protein
MTLTRITQRYQQQLLASTWVVFLGFYCSHLLLQDSQLLRLPMAPELRLLTQAINLI